MYVANRQLYLGDGKFVQPGEPIPNITDWDYNCLRAHMNQDLIRIVPDEKEILSHDVAPVDPPKNEEVAGAPVFKPAFDIWPKTDAEKSVVAPQATSATIEVTQKDQTAEEVETPIVFEQVTQQVPQAVVSHEPRVVLMVPCDTCGKSFQNKRALALHARKHRRP